MLAMEQPLLVQPLPLQPKTAITLYYRPLQPGDFAAVKVQQQCAACSSAVHSHNRANVHSAEGGSLVHELQTRPLHSQNTVLQLANCSAWVPLVVSFPRKRMQHCSPSTTMTISFTKPQMG